MSLATYIKSIGYKISHNGVSSELQHHELRKIKLLNSITFGGILVPVLSCVQFIIIKNYLLFLLDILVAIILITAFSLNNKGKFNIGQALFLFILPAYSFLYSFLIVNVGIELYFILFLIVGFYLYEKRIQLLLYSIYIVTLILLVIYFNIYNASNYPVIASEPYSYNINFFFSTILIISFILVFKTDSLKYQDTIKAQSDKLQLQVVELKRKDQLSERILRELNHRVKNNLQLISGLFTLQLYNNKDKIISQTLNDARNRVDTISILHQHLYKSDYQIRPNLKDYISELTKHLLSSAGMTNINLTFHVDNKVLETNLTTHIGLIVNELVTNAIKYAFSDQKKNMALNITIKAPAKCIEIIIEDNGSGFINPYTINTSDSFGLELVQDISNQYKGSLKLINNPGAQVTVILNI